MGYDRAVFTPNTNRDSSLAARNDKGESPAIIASLSAPASYPGQSALLSDAR